MWAMGEKALPSFQGLIIHSDPRRAELAIPYV
jgi:hypothetical protein